MVAAARPAAAAAAVEHLLYPVPVIAVWAQHQALLYGVQVMLLVDVFQLLPVAAALVAAVWACTAAAAEDAVAQHQVPLWGRRCIHCCCLLLAAQLLPG